MTLPTWYDTGTASVANGFTTVTGAGTLWGGDAIMAGDLFCDPAQPSIPPQRVKSVTGNGEIELWAPWPGTALTDGVYEIRYVGIIERSTAQTRRVLEQLGDVKSWADIFVATDADRLALETEGNPLPSGRRVLVIDDGLIWVKKTGVFDDWLPPVEFKGDRGDAGPFTEITFGPVTTGAAGTAASANVVVIDVDTVRIDLTLPKGADGTGTGDVAGPSGAVANRLAVFDGATGKLLKDGGKTIAELVPANDSVTNAILANMATATIKGRTTAGTGDPEDLTAAQALALLGAYARSNILGTVSQSSGVPTGAILENGSNANGQYVRFADGTMICTQHFSVTVGANAAVNTTWTFPAAFAAAPKVYPSASTTSPQTYMAGAGGTNGTTGFFSLFNGSGSSQTREGDAMAIGRWF